MNVLKSSALCQAPFLPRLCSPLLAQSLDESPAGLEGLVETQGVSPPAEMTWACSGGSNAFSFVPPGRAGASIVNGNLSKEADRFHDRAGTMFRRRASRLDRSGLSRRSLAALVRRLKTGALRSFVGAISAQPQEWSRQLSSHRARMVRCRLRSNCCCRCSRDWCAPTVSSRPSPTWLRRTVARR